MALRCQPLPPGDWNRSAAAAGADPMWVWADATRYRDQPLPADGGWWCLRERDGRIVTERLPAPDPRLEAGAELALPVWPRRMPPRPDRAVTPPSVEPVRGEPGRPLVGVIDSGCPFASWMLRQHAPDGGTRVLALWDQDDAPAFADGGSLPAGYGYGRAIGRAGLQDLMRRATRPGGALDEDHCYRLAGYTRVRERMSHGAAVLSQLLGAPLHGGSLQPLPGQPPRWDEPAGAVLPIDGADLVFVDLPKAGVQDSTSAALARYLLDGLRFILDHAHDGQRVVVNLSTGTSRTGHDGGSLVERGLRQCVADAAARGIDLHIVLPAGNGHLEQRHARLSRAGGALTFFLPPGCEMPQYVTLRWPAGAEGWRLRLTAPGGGVAEAAPGQALGLFDGAQACAGLILPAPAAAGEALRGLLAFAPTASDRTDDRPAPAGRWQIELLGPEGAPRLDEPVRFWVSRNQRNPGAKPRSRQADFIDVDRSHQPRAWLRTAEDLEPEADPRDGIRRRGAISGLATAARGEPRLVVVGGHFAAGRPGDASPYSASGESGSGLPQLSAPGDASRALRGLTVRGNRGTERARVAGTSFTAPLVARALVNGTLATALEPVERPRLGRRLLPADPG